MRRVVGLIERGDHREALVRIWVLATTRPSPGDDLPLNAWERASQRSYRSRRVDAIRSALDAGRSIDLATAETDPLALIVALDTFLGLDTAPRGFVNQQYQVEKRGYWLVPLNLSRTNAASSARQAGNPQSWFRYHRVVPTTLASGLRVLPQPSRDLTDTRLRDIKSAGRLWAFLGHFNDGVTLAPAPTNHFFASGLSDEGARATGVGRAFARAVEEKADIVVLPELTVTPAQREVLKERLREMRGSGRGPVLVVPGSFHEERDGQKVNAAELLAGDGRTLLVHEKLRPFGEADGVAEDIHAANVLRVLVTPIGSIALAICKDYCDELGPIREWDALAVDWWLVPSMGEESTINAHVKRAQSLWAVVNRAVTLLANQESGTQGAVASFPGFVFDGTRRNVDVGGGSLDITLSAKETDAKGFRRVK